MFLFRLKLMGRSVLHRRKIVAAAISRFQHLIVIIHHEYKKWSKCDLVSFKETHDDCVEPVSYISHNDNRISSDGQKLRCAGERRCQRAGRQRQHRRRHPLHDATAFCPERGSLTDTARLKSISGVLGVVRNDNQCQVIIGNTVSQAYREVVSLLPTELQPAVPEGPQKLTFRRIGAGSSMR
jgi:PTS system arbutin/cellobiose/salicin-specific IIC component